MSCFICGRASCATWMHSRDEQERYEDAIELFERAIELRNSIRDQEDEENADE